MFGCLKLRGNRKTYIINKGTNKPSTSSDSSPRISPPARRPTKHPFRPPSPSTDQDDDPIETTQPQNHVNHQSTTVTSETPAQEPIITNGDQNSNHISNDTRIGIEVEVEIVQNTTNLIHGAKNEQATPEIVPNTTNLIHGAENEQATPNQDKTPEVINENGVSLINTNDSLKQEEIASTEKDEEIVQLRNREQKSVNNKIIASHEHNTTIKDEDEEIILPENDQNSEVQAFETVKVQKRVVSGHNGQSANTSTTNSEEREGEYINHVPEKKTVVVAFDDEVEVIPWEQDDPDREYITEEPINYDTQEIRREGFREAVKLDLREDIKTHPKSEQEALDIKKAFRANEFLETVLKEDQLNTLVDAMYLREVEENEVIIQEGEPGNHLYVSAGGTYDVYISQKNVNSFNDFRVFGELAILYNAKRMATIKAVTPGRIWVLHRNIYQRTLVEDAIRDHDEIVSFLHNVPTINTMKEETLQKIANLFKKEFFKTDTVIVEQGDIGDKFYIIRAGNVTVTKKGEGKVAELSKGAFFGERALLQEDSRQATVTADAPGVECLTLTRPEFKEHFGDDDFDTTAGSQPVTQSPQEIVREGVNEFSDIQLDELKRVETLGVGGFGRVELVQHKQNPKLTFALKYLKKVDMIQQGQVDHVYNEKNIQISCDTVFVVRMYKTFSDNKYLYFLMESCLGGDLWTFLQKQKGRHVGDSAARFFAGCVLEALTYLHDRDYVYRDLKPENLIVDTMGYIKLTDFGFAKQISRNSRTFTFAGTPEYVAPEIVYNRGHDKAVDYWAFGIFIFELLVGRTPFRSDDPTHMKTYNRILRGINSVQFPPHMSRSGIMIVQKLCKAIPTERLGCQKNGAQDIRNHKWFQGFEWNKLRNRKMKSPFLPKLQSNIDTKYFEKFKIDDDVPPDEVGFDNFES